MEPITVFAISVGLVGGCRLAFVAADFLGKGIYSKGSKPVKLDNWYCFFKTADLLGNKKQAGVSRPETRQKQPAQQRPRPRAERNFR